MSKNPANEDLALISVRIVTIEHCMATPIEDIDVTYSNFRSSRVKKVPVLRVFGSTPAGQRTCLHLHGIFPYLYLPVPGHDQDGFIYRLAASIDKALNLSLTVALNPDGQAAENAEKSNVQHVFKIVEVSGRPFYGYHAREHRFFKVYFYNPWIMKRAADMLQTGAILGQVLQPHYSHVPYVLQFMMDYNLQGMNLLNLRFAKFRRKTTDVKQDERLEDTSILEDSLRKTNKLERIFTDSILPSYLLMPETVPPVTSCELEVDGVAADILNTNSSLLSTSTLSGAAARQPLMNPGLEAVCLDECNRRQEFGIEDRMTPPSTPPRGKKSEIPSDSESFWALRFKTALAQMKDLTCDEKVSDRTDSDSTVLFDPAKSAPEVVHAAETPESSDLPAATDVEEHLTSLSHSILETSLGRKTPSLRRSSSRLSTHSIFGRQISEEDDEEAKKERFFNDTLVNVDLLGYGPTTKSQKSSSQDSDDELLDLLQDLGDERENLLQANADETRSKEEAMEIEPRPSSAINKRQVEQDELDTLEMTQICWDIDPFQEVSSEDEDEGTKTEEVVGAKDLEESDESLKSNSDLWDGEKTFWENINLDDLN